MRITERIEKAAREYLKLKNDAQTIERKMGELKEVLEPFLDAQEEKEAELNGWKFKLVLTERETFSLSKAKEKIDGRILAPYISKSSYSQIRTTFRGGEKQAA